MALPKYDKNKRKKQFRRLPVGAYVVKILSAKEEMRKSGKGRHIKMCFDIAEGEEANFYMNIWNESINEDKKWPNDAVYYLTIPDDDSPEYVWTGWNTFFADLEESNNGFIFDTNKADYKTLLNKVIGGKFRNEQSEWNGTVYDHTKMAWTCVAEDVRTGNYGAMPKDKLITPQATVPQADADDFINVPDGFADGLPFA